MHYIVVQFQITSLCRRQQNSCWLQGSKLWSATSNG